MKPDFCAFFLHLFVCLFCHFLFICKKKEGKNISYGMLSHFFSSNSNRFSFFFFVFVPVNRFLGTSEFYLYLV